MIVCEMLEVSQIGSHQRNTGVDSDLKVLMSISAMILLLCKPELTVCRLIRMRMKLEVLTPLLPCKRMPCRPVDQMSP